MTESRPPGNAGEVVVVFFGWAMAIVGGMIAGLGGLCTLVFAAQPGEGQGYWVVGLIPMAFGGAVLLAGVILLRDRARRRRAWRPGPADVARFSDWTPPDKPGGADT